MPRPLCNWRAANRVATIERVRCLHCFTDRRCNCELVEAITTEAHDLPCCSWLFTKELREANRNVLYLIIGALAVATAGLGYQSIEINIGQRGVSIEKK